MNPSPILSRSERILGGLWGSLVGDALGVPVEFKDRATVQADPVQDMRGYGTHRQPPGTWSDDGALILCSVDSLINAEFDTEDMGKRFADWMYHGLWTAWGEPFDVGVATSDALMRVANGSRAEDSGSRDEYSNGNGSLMRILPVTLRFASASNERLIDCVHRASAITHGHLRSQMACGFHAFVIRQLLEGCPPGAALESARCSVAEFYSHASENLHFRGLLKDDLSKQSADKISSTGYVIHTLTASLWCLLTTTSYEECVLKAVNLGGDTDTTGCVAGGLAGVYYGFPSIPDKWRLAMARHDDVESLFNRFVAAVPSQP
jgi:ADP-ribosyl-[dinitrogen reductase] hydrolase